MTEPSFASQIADLDARLTAVRAEIAAAAQRSGRAADAVTLVAVTKTHPAAMLLAARQLGVTAIGENYLQEAEAKFTELGWPPASEGAPPVVRHAIGHIQSNKVRLALRWFEVIETLDSLRLAERLNQAAAALQRPVDVLLQINTSGESTKSGFFPQEVEGVLPRLANLAFIRVKGLMTIGRLVPDPEAARPEFAALRALRAQLQRVAPPAISLNELSMGMSHDFAVAIEEGATIVRIGSRLFGSRR